MSRNNNEKKSLPAEYFEAVYAAKDDPWDFATSEYEAAKYDVSIRVLAAKNYRSVLEIGCSIGILTAKLADYCQSLLAVDINEKALDQARERCLKLAHIQFQKMQVPEEFPDRNFDLIVVSEVGYYLDVEDWKKLTEKIIDKLKAKGNVLLVHWTHFVEDYPQTGDAVHDSFRQWSAGKLKHLNSQRTEDYRLDIWEKL